MFHGCAVHTGRLGTAMRCNALLALQLAMGLASGRAVVAAAQKPPSFVFMMLDDVGWADFGFMNSSFTTVKSPNIDAWAQAPTSMLLKDMHSGGTVCRSSIQTTRTTTSQRHNRLESAVSSYRLISPVAVCTAARHAPACSLDETRGAIVCTVSTVRAIRPKGPA